MRPSSGLAQVGVIVCVGVIVGVGVGSIQFPINAITPFVICTAVTPSAQT